MLPPSCGEGVSLAGRRANSFGIFHGAGRATVEVKFLPAVARQGQASTWHASQQLTPQKDGSLLAEFQLSDTEEIKRWIMSFGRHAAGVTFDAGSRNPSP